MSTVGAAIDPSGLFRLPWTAADNAMTWLEPTRRCNITCDACFATNDPRSEKSVERFRQELEETLRLRRSDAVLIGGGEPLTHPHLADIVAAVAAKGVKPVLITNGVGLDARRLRELKKAGLHGVTFHVDSHQKRPGWLGKDEAALNVLRDELADLVAAEEDLTCAFNTTIFPDSLASVPAIVAWAVARPEKVHVLTLICVRMVDPDGPFAYEVAGRPVDLARTPYAASVPCGDLTSEQLAAGIREVLPGFEFCGFLGGTVHPHALKWVIGSHLCTAGTSFGNLGPRAMELVQNGHHALRGRYLAYSSPRESRRGRLAFLLGVFDPSLRRALRRYLATVARHPGLLARRVHIQSLSVVQPVDILPNGEMDTCDGCPNRTYWNGRLVPACRLEEYQIYGGPFTAIPRGA